MARKKWSEPKGAVELLEESVELLRRSPLTAWTAYYAGSVPFGLALLYFWADMSRSSDATESLAPEALGVALLFLWMKAWQSVFTSLLWKTLSPGEAPPWTLGRFVRTLVAQASLQPWGLLAVPAAALALIPLPWVYGFFQNATVLGDGSERSFQGLKARAWKLAGLWPRQNAFLLLTVQFFGLFVFFNLTEALTLGPLWLKEFLGVDTLFSRSGYSLFNTTFFASACMLTYLLTDPLLKAAYTLRCFQGSSLFNGEDLKAGLQAAVPTSKAFLLILLLGLFCRPLGAQPAAPVPAKPAPAGGKAAVQPVPLDRSIEEALKGQEYRWHMPRVEPVQKKPQELGPVGRFLESSLRAVIKALQKVGNWIDKFFEWLNGLFQSKKPEEKPAVSSGWDFEWLYAFLWVLLGLVACALALLIFRLWKARDRTVVLAQPVFVKPDVADEKVTGNELPVDGWLQMAQELLEKGDFRLALRAFYLAGLAALAAQRLLTIAKFKSTMDYERELGRRAHSLPALLSAFHENGLAFDRGWYGDHEVTREYVQGFAVNYERIRKSAEPQNP